MTRRPKAEPQAAGPQGLSLLPVITVILGVMVGVQIAIFLLHAYQTITFPYQLDYGEGPILQIALRVARGQELYPPINRPPYVIASYEPLYYLLSALGVRITGPSFLVGRLISFLSALGAATCVALVVWWRTGHRFSAYVAGGLVLAMPHFLVWATLMRVDMLALALALVGYCLWARQRRAAAMLPFALGVFTRRTNIAAMGAAFTQYARERGWRPAVRAFAAQVLLILLLLAGGVLVTRGGMYHQLSQHTASSLGKAWSWAQLWSLIWFPLKVWPIYFVITVIGAIYCLAQPSQRSLFVFFIYACVIFLTGGRIGSAHNYLLEPTAVGAMMFGVMWAELSRRAGLARLALIVIGGAIAMQMSWTDAHLSYTISLLRAEIGPNSGRYIVERIREADGPVLCEDVGMTELAGKEAPLEPFEFTQMARHHALDPAPVFRQVRAGEYALIITRFDPFDPHEIELHHPGEDWKAGRWPDGLIQALVASYRLEQEVGPYFVFVPKVRPPGL
jgi:hypothetical protein